jgi:Protein of unknown function (DUF3224)
MQTRLSAKFEVTSWDETPFDDEDPSRPKVTRALVTKEYSGDIEGSSTTQWLMAYAEDGSATFVGLERITARFAAEEGTLVLQHVGSYEDGAAKAQLSVLEGANSGDLKAAKGSGEFLADPGGSVTLTLTSPG